MSTLLFHGPAAREAAVLKAQQIGRLLAPPFGDDGLKVDTCRQIVEMLSSIPVGDQKGVVVVGPLDEAKAAGTLDVLLKTLEEFDARYLQPILWAKDAGSVIKTVRSRCLETWCPTETRGGPEVPYMKRAEAVCQAALERRRAALIEGVIEAKGEELMLLRAATIVLASKDEWPWEARLLLWGQVREALNQRKPSHLETLSAFWV